MERCEGDREPGRDLVAGEARMEILGFILMAAAVEGAGLGGHVGGTAASRWS